MRSLAEEVARLARGECSARELVDEAIARIEALDPRLNAVIHPRFERAREEAARPVAGRFRGVPILVKDAGCAIAGEPLHEGLAVAKAAGYRAASDGGLTRRLAAAGFILLGRTNVPELCTHATTEPVAYGPTRNPWSPERSAGGSSGGSAAAVAAGMVAVAHGSDGGGSLRAPAAWCGLVALKPSRGRISCGPEAGERWAGLSSEGFLTRSVRDSALVLDAVCGSEPGDPYTTPLRGSLAAALARRPGRLRIGLRLRGAGDADATHPEVAASVQRLAARLADLGHDVREAWPEAIDEPEAVAQQGNVVSACVAAELEEWSQRLGRAIPLHEIEPRNQRSVSQGRSLGAAEFVRAREWLHAWGRRLHAWWSDFDLLLTPALTRPAIPIGSLPLAPSAEDLARMRRELGWLLGMWNASGQPALCLPARPTRDGLPVGAQLVAGFGRDALLLQVARQLEREEPWESWPG